MRRYGLLTAALLGLAAAPAWAAPDKAEVAAKMAEQQLPGEPMIKADPDMAAVLDKLAALKPKPIETLSAAEARQQPSIKDAADALLRDKGRNPADPMGVGTKDITYDGAAGKVPARLYVPEGLDPNKQAPVILYFHGGGWVIADLDVYDATPRAIAKATGAIVMSAHYRQAPEHKFPAAHDDAFAAYQWVLANAASFGGDAKRVALLGESAGGNLAINTAIKARDAKLPLPVYQVLVYPVAGVDMTTRSYVANAMARPLNKPMMEWFVKQVVTGDSDKQDPRIDLVGKADLAGLPPATVITAQIDPLQSEGQMLAAKLEKSGVKTELKDFTGMTHEFFGLASLVSQAKDAQKVAVRDLRAAFDK